MKAYFFGAQNSGFSTSATIFQPVSGADGSATLLTTDALASLPLPHALTVDQFNVGLTTAPGVGKSYTITVMKNGVATAISVVISDNNTLGQDSINSVAFARGDTFSLRIVPSGTPAATGMASWTLRQSATGCFAVIGGSTSAVTATAFVGPIGGQGSSTTESNEQAPIPCPGTFSNLVVKTDSAPGGAGGNAITATSRKNTADGALTATVTDPATTASDLTHSVAVVAGDLFATHLVVTGTPSVRVGVGYTFTPTSDGDAFLTHANSSTGSTSATNYDVAIGGQGASWSATESQRAHIAPPITVKAYWVLAVAAPGGTGKQYTVTLRKNGAGTAATVVCASASANQKSSVTGLNVAVAQNDLIATESVPASTPFSSALGVGIHYVDASVAPPASTAKLVATWTD